MADGDGRGVFRGRRRAFALVVAALCLVAVAASALVAFGRDGAEAVDDAASDPCALVSAAEVGAHLGDEVTGRPKDSRELPPIGVPSMSFCMFHGRSRNVQAAVGITPPAETAEYANSALAVFERDMRDHFHPLHPVKDLGTRALWSPDSTSLAVVSGTRVLGVFVRVATGTPGGAGELERARRLAALVIERDLRPVPGVERVRPDTGGGDASRPAGS